MVAMAAALIVAGGVALAETVTCDNTPPCHGTPETDQITGTASGEFIFAYEGNDNVRAGGGNDTIEGGPGNDNELNGEGASDTHRGGRGNDFIGADLNDSVGSEDESFGGRGNDTIFALDGNVDIIDCGRGTADRVFFDQGLDTVTSCEIRN